jgi:cytochrome bd-type quinol oxidase subunit 2
MPGSSARQFGRLVLGSVGIAFLIATVFAANAAGAAEPYRTWTDYFGTWATITAVCTALLAFILTACFCLPCALEGLKTNRADAFIGATLVTWRVVPFALIWTFARLIDASYHPGFNGPMSTGPLPPIYKPIAAIIGLPFLGFAFPVICICLGSVRADQIRRSQREPEHLCPHCGYSTLGLPSNTCPECGRSTNVTHPS